MYKQIELKDQSTKIVWKKYAKNSNLEYWTLKVQKKYEKSTDFKQGTPRVQTKYEKKYEKSTDLKQGTPRVQKSTKKVRIQTLGHWKTLKRWKKYGTVLFSYF